MRYELYFSLVSVADDGAKSELSIAENLTIDVDPNRAKYRARDGTTGLHGYGNDTMETIIDYIRARTTRMVMRRPHVRYSRRVY